MISIVIPLFNEEENIPQLQSRLIEATSKWSLPFEAVLVNDGSSDNTPQMLDELAKKDSRFRIIHFSRNFGHQPAISAGIKHAKGNAVIIMDGDLQDPPEILQRFIDKWQEGYEVVYAIRTKRKEGFFKKLGYATFYRVLRFVSDIEIPLDSGDFCLMDRKVVNALNHEMPENIRFVRGLRAYAGFKQIGVAYERDERAAGEVKYTFKKLMGLAIDGLIGFSIFPLRLATYFGFLVAFPSFLACLFFILHRILGFKILGYSPQDTPGIATLAVAIFFLGGIILIILGIIGEYLGRIYIEVKRRPFYIVSSITEKVQNQ